MDFRSGAPTICARCVCDTTISSISFDSEGVCNLCKSHDRLSRYYKSTDRKEEFNILVEKIKNSGKGRHYDCIVGVSGGTDSIYTLYMAKKIGLRPLAVHFDNGWNKEVAVANIKNACVRLGVELFTFVVNWEEFRDLQVSFLKASVPDIEVPTDIAIHGTLYRLARQEGVGYILGGQCFFDEGTVPVDWSFIDGTYVQDVHKRFGSLPLKNYPNMTAWDIGYNTIVRGIRQVPILNYLDYRKSAARDILEKELGWKYYGGHHYENTYSQFAFGYYSVVKFGIDKRKISLSGPVRSGFMSRENALEQLNMPPQIDTEIVSYCIKKLGLSQSEFEDILNRPNRSFRDYRTSYFALQRLRPFVNLAVTLKFISPVVSEKFLNS